MSATKELIRLKRKQLEQKKAKAKSKPWRIEQFLFREQLALVQDPSRFATAVCSVRAGKSVACAADLINTALTMPGTTGIYITLTRTMAERIVWAELKRINYEYGLGALANESKLSLAFPMDKVTGKRSIIYLLGANTEVEIEKIRGLSDVALVYLDECQAFRPYVKELVEDIITKRLYDTNGRCRLIGTPGPVLAGYFYDCAENSNQWSHHGWTLHANFHLQAKSGMSGDEIIQQDCDQRGVTVEHPSIQRECFGRWVYDPNALLLHYRPEQNHYDMLPPDHYEYVLGVDFGVKDSDSLTLLAYSASTPKTWLVEEIITPNQGTDALADQIKALVTRYGEMRMVADAGALGKKLVMDILERYGIVLEEAYKPGKMANYRLLNNALRTGMFMAKKDSRFAQDCNKLEMDRQKSTPDRIVVKGHSDAVDSALYAFKLSPAYDYKPPKFKAVQGTPEYVREQEELHKQAIRERIQREQGNKDGVMKGFYKDASGRDPWHSWDD
jgi:hypothetical protein